MTVVHGPAENKSEMGRQVSARCEDSNCRWCLPEADSQHLRLPAPFPMRFQHQIASGLAQMACPKCPSLFCGQVGEGEVDATTGHPRWLACREAECENCGFSVRFPPCPTVSELASVTARVMSSSLEYVKWLENEIGDKPPRKKLGEIDQLVETKMSGRVFFRYLSECMDLWFEMQPCSLSPLPQDATFLRGKAST
jgi:hypothetical protein